MRRTIYIILLVGLFLILISSLGFLAKALFAKRADAAQITRTSMTIANTKISSPAITNVSPTAALSLSYEFLSPTKIKKGEVIFDIYATWLTCTELEFEIAGTFPPDFPLESNGTSTIFKSMELIPSPPNISLKLDPFFGGGGGSDVNNVHIRGRGLAYYVNPPLTVGQKIHITALVTFNEIFGIAKPVPFNLDITVQQCQ